MSEKLFTFVFEADCLRWCEISGLPESKTAMMRIKMSMTMREYIMQSMSQGVELRERTMRDEAMMARLETVAHIIFDAVGKGGKVLLCGNGGSAADAQHIAAELVGRFETERRGLAAVALTTDTSVLTSLGNDYGMEYVFERQVKALGREGDVLIAITTSGNSRNIHKALQAAREQGVVTVGLLGGTGGTCREICDHAFVVDSNVTARVQEMHITLGHIICGLVDRLVAGNE